MSPLVKPESMMTGLERLDEVWPGLPEPGTAVPAAQTGSPGALTQRSRMRALTASSLSHRSGMLAVPPDRAAAAELSPVLHAPRPGR